MKKENLTPTEYIEMAIRCVHEKHELLHNVQLKMNDPILAGGVAVTILMDLGSSDYPESDKLDYLKASYIYLKNLRQGYLSEMKEDARESVETLSDDLDKKIVSRAYDKIKEKRNEKNED